MSIAEKLFGFQGRLRRRDWWLLGVAVSVVQFAVDQAVLYALYGPAGTLFGPGDFIAKAQSNPHPLVDALVGLPFLWPQLALTVKRRHDRGKSGWLAAILQLVVYAIDFVPDSFQTGLGRTYDLPLEVAGEILPLIVGVCFLIVLGLLDSAKGANAYGPFLAAEAGARPRGASPLNLSS